MEILDKIALVVGGAGGIGSAIAEVMRDAGARVIVTAIDDTEQLDASVRLTGIDIRVLDIADDLAVQRMAAEIGTLDILVNCAGVTSRGEASFGEEEFLRVNDINVNGSMRTARAFRATLAERRGCIINIASMMSFRGSGTAPGYAASKGAVMQLTKSLAIAWAPKGDGEGIRVNAIAPGFIITPMTDAQIDPAYRTRVNESTPMGRWGEPRHIADVALFLASDRASFITGVILPVDGGYLAS
jgi:NAD(P)-dependent dehydrogenase (short-subunit alcohol dehydrogenase family)